MTRRRDGVVNGDVGPCRLGVDTATVTCRSPAVTTHGIIPRSVVRVAVLHVPAVALYRHVSCQPHDSLSLHTTASASNQFFLEHQ